MVAVTLPRESNSRLVMCAGLPSAGKNRGLYLVTQGVVAMEDGAFEYGAFVLAFQLCAACCINHAFRLHAGATGSDLVTTTTPHRPASWHRVRELHWHWDTAAPAGVPSGAVVRVLRFSASKACCMRAKELAGAS